MLKQINYLTIVANEHVTQAMDHVGEVTGRTWRPFAWGFGWKQWFLGVVVYRPLTSASPRPPTEARRSEPIEGGR